MTVRNDELYQMFVNGEKGGVNHTETMQIREAGDVTLLMGYGSQIYAHRSQDGTVTRYIGWLLHDTSNTTNRQVASLPADKDVDARPMVVDWTTGEVNPDGAEEIRNLE